MKNYTRKNHKTPRPLMADAYTIGANQFQSEKAKEKSVYYITFRRELYKIDPDIYNKGDNRIIFGGLQRIIDEILFEPIQQWEIDESERFLKYAKITGKGFKNYYFPKDLWQRIVDDFGGRIPIRIKAMPEGSVIYPNEPCVCIENIVDGFEDITRYFYEMLKGFGEMSAHFESKLLQCWAATERITQDIHLYDNIRIIYKTNFPHLTQDEINFYASISVTDFGDRAGMSEKESEDQGMYGLYVFTGTDTFCGAYQAWKNSNEATGVFSSVYALAHRNVQAFEEEGDAYNKIYEIMQNDEFGSMVNDCYSSKNSVKKYHVPLALKSKAENNGKIVVSRTDSGDPKEEIMRILNAAIQNGLYTIKTFPNSDKIWYDMTYLKALEGDGLTNHDILDLIRYVISQGFLPWSSVLPFGQGGGKRNNLKRDNLSAKYALSSMGEENTGVVKFSDTIGKTTLPGPFKVLRSKKALENKKTIVFLHEDGVDAMVVYYDGLKEDFFGEGMMDNFITIKNRIHYQFDNMPKTLTTDDNHNYPASDDIINERKKLLIKYAPDKNVENY
jgi:nicotinamide phosphoribosyltransferase